MNRRDLLQRFALTPLPFLVPRARSVALPLKNYPLPEFTLGDLVAMDWADYDEEDNFGAGTELGEIVGMRWIGKDKQYLATNPLPANSWVYFVCWTGNTDGDTGGYPCYDEDLYPASELRRVNHTKPMLSRRRIDQFKAIAYDQGLTNEDAKQFGKLSKTATWQALLDTQSLDTRDWTNDGSFPVCNFTPQSSTSFLDWVDFGQLLALVLASAGVTILLLSLWPRINPLNLFPQVKITIQVGEENSFSLIP